MNILDKAIFGVVYGIENLLNHKIYVGQTTRNADTRFKEHAHADSRIGRAIRKYGTENFAIVVLEKCASAKDLNASEIQWIARLGSKSPNGYNLTDGGEGASNPTPETRAKIAAAARGNKNCLGRKASPETRAKLSAAAMGNKRFVGHKLSPEHRAKLLAARKGCTLSAEHRAKLSAAHKGKAPWNKGKKASPEARAKMSAAKKGKKRPRRS